MGIKEVWQGLIGKTEGTKIVAKKEKTAIKQIASADLFPIVNIPETTLQKYKKIPLSGLASLGTAFSKLTAASNNSLINSPEPLYRAINPKGIAGTYSKSEFGLNGNIMQINSQGKSVVKGRLQFEEVGTLPFDPSLMVAAVAVMAIEQKLDKLQERVEEVLQFLELEKQAEQRGNLKKLAEISDDYKIYCEDTEFCKSRNIIVQDIERKALGDIEFYKEKISAQIQKQKAIHFSTNADSLMNNVIHEFAEYQLSCYLYSYCTFMDTMLRTDFSTEHIARSRERMLALADEYNTLFSDCYSQIEKYHLDSVDAKLVDGVGTAIKGLAKTVSTIPVAKNKQFDEALIEAGRKLNDKKACTIKDKLETIKVFEDNHIVPFADNLSSVDIMYNGENSMLTDGENVYVLQC